MRAVLSIGSNIGDRAAHLRSAVLGFGSEVRAVSPLYETPPWGEVEQQNFFNAVVVVETPRSPVELLRFCQSLEAAAFRRRDRHWGPRTLDIDLVCCSDHGEEITSNTEELRLPHPYAAQRAFVLVPWLDVDPAATLGGSPIANVVESLESKNITMLAKEWV